MSQALPPTGLPTRHTLLNGMDEEYCTVMFRLQGEHPTTSEFLLELSQYVENSGTVEIVRFQVCDDLGHPHA